MYQLYLYPEFKSSNNYDVAVESMRVCRPRKLCSRSRHRTRRLVIFIVVFMIFIYQFLVSSLVTSSHKSKRSTGGGTGNSLTQHFLFEPMHGKGNESSNFTKHLWVFNNSDAERIFLYANLLAEHKWTPNPEYLDLFRRELIVGSNTSTEHGLVITQSNVRMGEELVCYITIKDLLPKQRFFVTEHFMSILPKESPVELSKRYNKCAVVGNSGSIRDSQCGAEIDSMDYVFRCNGAPLKDFTLDAGTKTNFVTFNPSILHKRFGKLSNSSLVDAYVDFMNQYDGMVWYPCFGSKHVVKPCLESMTYQDRIRSRLYIAHPDHYSAVWEFWKRRGVLKKPSTGLYLMSVAATMCNEVHLYGFWPFPVELHEGALRQTPYHYFNNIPFSNYHNTDTEFRILLQMHLLGAINLHTGTCRQSYHDDRWTNRADKFNNSPLKLSEILD